MTTPALFLVNAEGMDFLGIKHRVATFMEVGPLLTQSSEQVATADRLEHSQEGRVLHEKDTIPALGYTIVVSESWFDNHWSNVTEPVMIA